MLLTQNGYSCEYEMRLFYGLFFDSEEDIYVNSDFKAYPDRVCVYTEIVYYGDVITDEYDYSYISAENSPSMTKKVYTACCTKSFCRAARKIKDINLPWGVMCGIRPAKNVRELSEKEGIEKSRMAEVLKDIYDVSEEKANLAIRVADNEEMLLKQIGENSVSLYIGIPFCPTRCLYCSFVSTDIRVSGKYMDEFVEKLLLEIDKTAEIVRKMGCYAENIYIGGGTPTTLSAHQLEMIFKRLRHNFDFSKIKEFTLEAGRPDTITYEKLITARENGVNRISINPQSMNDETLKRVGRAHSAQMVRECFNMARKAEIPCINADLIAGLPGEDSEMFARSLDEVIALKPENITVHSMCIKRAARLRHTNEAFTRAEEMNKMLSYTQKRMEDTGMVPYYMYRQKNILGNLENVGYSYPGFMSVYNINIMEEKQTILALGGGGSTKIVRGDRIERVFNFKDPYEYIKRFDEILKKKDEALELYGKAVSDG